MDKTDFFMWLTVILLAACFAGFGAGTVVVAKYCSNYALIKWLAAMGILSIVDVLSFLMFGILIQKNAGESYGYDGI